MPDDRYSSNYFMGHEKVGLRRWCSQGGRLAWLVGSNGSFDIDITMKKKSNNDFYTHSE